MFRSDFTADSDTYLQLFHRWQCSQGVFVYPQAQVFRSDFTAERDARSQLFHRRQCSQGVFVHPQAEVFRFDFTAERDARSQLATDKDRLAQELEAEQLKSQGLSDQLMRYTQQQLQDMQLRASQGTAAPHFYNYPRHNTYPAQPEAYQHAAGYMMGGGGDGGAGGSFNDLSGGEDGHVMQGQNYGGGGGGQSYGAGGRQNYGAGGGQNYGGGGGQHYGGGGQNYPGRQHYPGQEGSLHPQAGHNMPPPQGTVVDSQHGSAHAQYQQTQVSVGVFCCE